METPKLIKDLGYLYPTETSKQKYSYGIYLCNCGSQFRTQKRNIKNGHTKSCGCYNKLRTKETHTKHNLVNHNIYKTWCRIKSRCNASHGKNYKNYKMRGITVCSEWINDFKAFYEWSINNGYQEHLTIDRKDNDKGYNPDNCRYTTQTVQSRNTRKIRKNNTTGYRGVSYCKDKRKYRAYISLGGRYTHLGYSKDALECAIIYDKYVKENNLEHTTNF